MKLEDLNVGDRALVDGEPCTVVFVKPTHSVPNYRDYALVQFDRLSRGWDAGAGNIPLVPRGELHLHGLCGLLWVRPERVKFLYHGEIERFEVDED